MNALFLGLDLGTSGCKLVAFNANGQAVALASRSYRPVNPRPGFFELDADYVWTQAEECFLELNAKSLPGTVRTIAITTLGEAVVPVAKDGKVLDRAHLSADNRCGFEVSLLQEKFGPARIYEVTGQPISPQYTLPKLMWRRIHTPELIERAWKFLGFGEFALLRMGCEPVIDISAASRTQCIDLRTRSWSQELLDFARFPVEKLAAISETGTELGVLDDMTAQRLALPCGVRVVLGGHDQIVGALGAGIVSTGMAMYSLGTTEALVASVTAPSVRLGEGNIPCTVHAVPGQYAALAGNQSGGRVLDWYSQTMRLPGTLQSRANLSDVLSSLDDAVPRGPILLPHFLGSGSVLNDHHSLAALFGLSFDTTSTEIFHAVLEGITMEQAISLDTLAGSTGPITQLRAVGGGTKSALWLQVKADILNCPITKVAVKDAPCLGSAILGRAVIESPASVADLANKMVTTTETFNPRPDRHEAYRSRLGIYRDLYFALKPLAKRLREQWSAMQGNGQAS